MWFKNLQLFNLEQAWSLAPGALEAALAQRVLQPCTALSLSSRGWMPPTENGALVESLDRHLLIALGIEEKLLPASVIKDAATEHAAEWEHSRGMKPGRKLMREFKDRAVAELLPRAFARRRIVRAWIDPSAGRLVVDSSSPARAELVTEALRDLLGNLNLSLPQADHAPADTMTGWLRRGDPGGRFALGEECELSSNDDARSLIKYLRQPLPSDTLRRQLDAGFRATKLALVWNERIGFTIDEKLQIRKLRFLGIEETEREVSGNDAELTAGQHFEAEFALMTGGCAALLDDLMAAFDIRARR